MNKNQILENLAEIAAALDDQNMTREADAVTQVMTRVAQQAPNPFAPTDLRQMTMNDPQMQLWWELNGRHMLNQPTNMMFDQPPKPQYLMQQPQQPAAQSSSQEDDLIKRYLGWAFHAISVKKVSVANARAALQQHLQANKQTPEFIQKTLQAFDSQIASQQALQGK
jgi:hypothetical protein